jgi:hypothetical protein
LRLLDARDTTHRTARNVALCYVIKPRQYAELSVASKTIFHQTTIPWLEDVQRHRGLRKQNDRKREERKFALRHQNKLAESPPQAMLTARFLSS